MLFDWTPVIYGLLAAFGALCFDVWGFIQTAPTAAGQGLAFDWRVSLVTVIPTLVIAFLAAYYTHPSPPIDYVLFITSGYGLASAQEQLNMRSFWTAKPSVPSTPAP